MFYSLIDDLSFLLNSLPPYNGAISLTNTALLSVIPVKPGVPARAAVQRDGAGSVYDFRAAGHAAGCEDAGGGRMELHHGAST